MSSPKLCLVLPCAAFFSEGLVLPGIVALFMQASLVLWPVASRWARVTTGNSGVQKRLAQVVGSGLQPPEGGNVVHDEPMPALNPAAANLGAHPPAEPLVRRRSAFRLSNVVPFAAFFAQGRVVPGIIALFMQVSLVFWPMAARWARANDEQTGMERKLAELSETHRVHNDPYAKQPEKKFRQLA